MPEIGAVSFVPGSQDPTNPNQPPGGAPSGAPPQLQQAIRLLSLRLPRLGGVSGGLAPGAIAPGALLSGAGGAALGAGGGSLEAILRALFGLGGAGAAPGAVPGAGFSGVSQAAPRVVPGTQPGTTYPSPPPPSPPKPPESAPWSETTNLPPTGPFGSQRPASALQSNLMSLFRP